MKVALVALAVGVLTLQDKVRLEWRVARGDVFKLGVRVELKTEPVQGADSPAATFWKNDVGAELIAQAVATELDEQGNAVLEIQVVRMTAKGRLLDRDVEIEFTDGELKKADAPFPQFDRAAFETRLKERSKVRLGKRGEFEHVSKDEPNLDFDLGPGLPKEAVAVGDQWPLSYRGKLLGMVLPETTLQMKYEKQEEGLALLGGEGEGEGENAELGLKTRVRTVVRARFAVAEGLMRSSTREITMESKGTPPGTDREIQVKGRLVQKMEISK